MMKHVNKKEEKENQEKSQEDNGDGHFVLLCFGSFKSSQTLPREIGCRSFIYSLWCKPQILNLEYITMCVIK